MTIFFYATGKDYDIFSNVTDIGFVINVNGKRYRPRSSEAVYQDVKGLTGPYIDNNYTGGYDPRKYTYANAAEPHFSKPRTQITVKEQLMYEILLVKFTQNRDILKALLDTGDKTIIANTQGASDDDSFWGNGHRNNGDNALGHALMRVRQDLRKELSDTGKIRIRIGFSQNLAVTLGHTNHEQLTDDSITQQQLNTTTACTCTLNRASQSANSHTVTQGSTTSQYNQNRLFHNSPNPVPSSSSHQTALQFVEVALEKKWDSRIQAQMLNANKDKYFLVLRFQNQASANTFKNKYNLTITNFGNNPNLLALGQATAEKLLNDPQQLNIPKYGKTNPKPTWQALVFQHEQTLVEKLSFYDQAKIQKVDNLITTLEREINSRWPYPNKALKRLKVEALKTIKTHVLHGDTFDVAVTYLKKTANYGTIIQGKRSHRVYDLLQELAPNAKSSLLSFRY